MSTDRHHSLDALRAFALLLGVVFHSTLAYLLPPGLWAVGTASPSPLLGWFVFYTHSFRMELFFLLAGFFAALVVEKRGVGAFIWNRLRRIVLVFVLLLYPMKFLLASLWMIGGRQTGWLVLPPEAAALPWWRLSLGGIGLEHWPNLQLTHLWFLYYLACVTALFLAVRWLFGRMAPGWSAASGRLQQGFRWLLSNWSAPLLLALVVTPLIAAMKGPDVDTPDQSLAWTPAVLALYGVCFTVGWWLHRNHDLLDTLGRRWKWFLAAGLILSLPTSASAAILRASLFSGTTPALGLKWLTSLGVGLTMMLSAFGWLGCFVRCFNRPSPAIRYVAASSYWIYLAHLALVVALQIVLANWRLPWWVAVPIVNVAAFAILLASYEGWRRFRAPAAVRPAMQTSDSPPAPSRASPPPKP